MKPKGLTNINHHLPAVQRFVRTFLNPLLFCADSITGLIFEFCLYFPNANCDFYPGNMTKSFFTNAKKAGNSWFPQSSFDSYEM